MSKIPLWLDILSRLTPALITLMIGIIGAYITFRQYKVNSEKLKLELFDKRLEAYEKAQSYFAHLTRNANVSDEAFATLYEARYKSQFLFGDEILEHLNEIRDKAIRIRNIQYELTGDNPIPVGKKRTRLARELGDLLEWNHNQREKAPERYSKYLKFRV